MRGDARELNDTKLLMGSERRLRQHKKKQENQSQKIEKYFTHTKKNISTDIGFSIEKQI